MVLNIQNLTAKLSFLQTLHHCKTCSCWHTVTVCGSACFTSLLYLFCTVMTWNGSTKVPTWKCVYVCTYVCLYVCVCVYTYTQYKLVYVICLWSCPKIFYKELPYYSCCEPKFHWVCQKGVRLVSSVQLRLADIIAIWKSFHGPLWTQWDGMHTYWCICWIHTQS
jgi:hypothetical protein